VLASLGFSFYVNNFGAYDAIYGSLGAVIVLLMWLYVMGLVLIIGAEINALVELYASDAKPGQQMELRNRGLSVGSEPSPSTT
jgi:membrane protein